MSTQFNVQGSQIGAAEDLSAKAVEMYLGSDAGKRAEHLIGAQNTAKVKGPLQWIAITQSILPFLLLPFLMPLMSKGVPWAWQMEIALGAIAAAFWVTWFWSLTSPFPAAIVGLVLYTSLSYVQGETRDNDPNNNHPLPFIGIVGIVNIVLLTQAIIRGSRQRRMELASIPQPDGTLGKMPGGIASAMWLYLACLYIVVVPRRLMQKQEWEFTDSFKVQYFLAIVVATWAILSWRDILPIYRKFADRSWYMFGFLFAVATSLFASVWIDLMHLAIGIVPAKSADIYFENGYGWLTVIVCTAIFPAIFEEMAFRGVVLSCLKRVLSDYQAIAVTAIMFMILHLSVFSAPHLLLLACAMGYVRIRSGSIWPCVLMHFTHNGMCLVLERFFG